MRSRLCFTVVLIVFALGLVSLAPAQQAAPRVQPSGQVQATSVLRTPEMMDAFEATNVAPTPRVAPFRPTMDLATYKQLKQQAAHGSRPNISSPGSFAPPVFASEFAGPNECNGTGGCWYPPDVSASSGAFNELVAVHNNLFSVYSNAGVQLKLISLNAFFGYATQPFTDPRVVYDSVWSRWCVTSVAFPESATVQFLGIACSVNGNALGGWHVYLVDVAFGGSGGFYDFPMVGDSQDSALFTANVFTSTGFQGSSLFAVSKATLFNGRGFSVPLYLGLQATLQPARELIDGNGVAWLAAANSAGSGTGNIAMYALGYPAASFGYADNRLYGPFNLAVPAYSAPPSAPQAVCTGAANNLDTSDTRFVNMGIQNGDLYYQAHSINDVSATPRYYIISGLKSFDPVAGTASLALKETGLFFATSTSSDFNVSIAADGGNRMVLNWTSVDATNSVNPQVRFTGKLSTDPAINGSGIGTVAYNSPACLSGNFQNNFGEQRWGDYSQASSDPATSGQFWIDNEVVNNTNTWSTEIVRIHF